MPNQVCQPCTHVSGKDLIDTLLATEEITLPENFKSDLVSFIPKLCTFEEEEQKISPHLLIGTNLNTIFSIIPGRRVIIIKECPREKPSLKKTIKSLARFCSNGWTIFVDLEETNIIYGICRSFTGPQGMDLEAGLFDQTISDSKYIYLYPSSREEIVIRGQNSGTNRVVLAFEDVTQERDALPLSSLAKDLTMSISTDFSEMLEKVFLKLFKLLPQKVHGGILLVLNNTEEAIPELSDGVYLNEPIDIAQAAIDSINNLSQNSLSEEYYGLSGLLFEMLNTDGITIMDTYGRIHAYNVFLSQSQIDASEVSGGARRRTAEALLTLSSSFIVGVYFQSQDGFSFYRRKPHDA